jgi:hypothetical protein
MRSRDWLNHLRAGFAAVAAGGRVIPMGDNSAVHRSLAVRLAELREGIQAISAARVCHLRAKR